MIKEWIDTKAINDWIYQDNYRPHTQGQAYAAICSLLSWIAMEVINRGRGDYGLRIKHIASKFGQKVSESNITSRNVSDVQKDVRKTCNPNLLPRLAQSMNAWIKREQMIKMRAELREHNKNGTCPRDTELNKMSVQLATCVAVSNGARPQNEALMCVGDMSSLQKNTLVTSSTHFTIQLMKFNPYRTGTILSDSRHF